MGLAVWQPTMFYNPNSGDDNQNILVLEKKHTEAYLRNPKNTTKKSVAYPQAPACQFAKKMKVHEHPPRLDGFPNGKIGFLRAA